MNIFQALFGKSEPDSRSTDQLIFDLAEYGNRPVDLKELYRRLPKLDLFAKVLSANFPIVNGQKHTITARQDLKIQTASLPNGQMFARFHIDRADARLRPDFVSLSARAACEMVMKNTELSGLVVWNAKDSWSALPKSEIQRLLRAELAEA